MVNKYFTFFKRTDFKKLYYEDFNPLYPLPIVDRRDCVINNKVTPIDSGDFIIYYFKLDNKYNKFMFFCEKKGDIQISLQGDIPINPVLYDTAYPDLYYVEVILPIYVEEIYLKFLFRDTEAELFNFCIFYNSIKLDDIILLEEQEHHYVKEITEPNVRVYTLPFNYIPNNKHLKVWLDGVRLLNNIDFIENNSTTITLLTPPSIGQHLLFECSPVQPNSFYLIDNLKNSFGLEHSFAGKHIFKDTNLNLLYTIEVTNGSLILVPLQRL